MQNIGRKLSPDFDIHTINFTGHGGKPMPADGFNIEYFSGDALQYLNSNKIEKANVFGYSMGGYVALHLARYNPERIAAIFTLDTKFTWTPEIAAQEVKMLNPSKIEEKIPAFAKALERRHSPCDWKKVLTKTAEMMARMGQAPPLSDQDFLKIHHRVLITMGTEDKMVSAEESQKTASFIKNGQFKVLPGLPHPIEQADPEILIPEIRNFFK